MNNFTQKEGLQKEAGKAVLNKSNPNGHLESAIAAPVVSGGKRQKQAGNQTGSLPWVQVAPDAPYFITEEGKNWTPIGQNDAITWPDFANAFRRKDLKQVEGHLAWLAQHGVTCLRFMLEYAQTENRYIERPIGKFSPNMVRLWDDLFALCARYNMRILLTPVDTFWMWIRWKHHPYNRQNGGPCASRSNWLTCPDTLAAIKNRFTFVIERWGGSGVLFAWDLWNEIHPAHAGNRTDVFTGFISELSTHVREMELRLYGRSRPQTVSVYGPVLDERPDVADAIFRHPMLDFASTHFYDAATINHPKDTVASAICTGKLTREALQHLQDNRPFFDSEHGPIHAFKDLKRTLPEPFDDEYFRHMQWAHLASGGAGGGMRWPNRHPHTLTHGMRQAQKSMAAFTNLIEWKKFRRKNLSNEVEKNTDKVAVFACADAEQAVIWVLRQDTVRKREGTLDTNAAPVEVALKVPGMDTGKYLFTIWNTAIGKAMLQEEAQNTVAGSLSMVIPAVKTDVALAIRKIG
jgi:mannan endo-1,4-beta-mannosidase